MNTHDTHDANDINHRMRLSWSRDRLEAAQRLNALMPPRRGVTVWEVVALVVVVVFFVVGAG